LAYTGTLQIRNWKPVSCDVIVDDPSATIDDVLGAHLAPLTMLRIRLRRWGHHSYIYLFIKSKRTERQLTLQWGYIQTHNTI